MDEIGTEEHHSGTIKKNKVDHQIDLSDNSEDSQFRKRLKFQCKPKSVEPQSLVSNSIGDFQHKQKQENWLSDTNVNVKTVSVIPKFDAAKTGDGIYLSNEQQAPHSSSPEPGPSTANHRSAKYSATEKHLVPHLECTIPEEDPKDNVYFGLHTNDEINKCDEKGRVLVNINHPPDEADVFLAPQLSRVAKAHQIGGIRFLYDNIVQSLGKFSISEGAGCVLAHSMGLGKTFQICAFSDVLLQHTSARRVLIVVPLNTIQNWMSEFNHWLPADEFGADSEDGCVLQPRSFQVNLLDETSKDLNARTKVISDWTNRGGVLLMGYELFRQLYTLRENMVKKRTVNGKTALNAESEKEAQNLEQIYRALVNPGPDMIICDEGHRLKNDKTSTSVAFKEVRTRRRIVLTGYPMQNNLREYWVMIDFVRPGVLGTKSEFKEHFQKSIEKGQCSDSRPTAVKLMKQRVLLLQDLLKDFVQRRSQTVLQETLPHKEDHVLLLRMSIFQRQLYTEHMSQVSVNKGVLNPLRAYAIGIKIWNHPDVFYKFLKNGANENIEIDHEETLLVDSAMPCLAPPNTETPDRSGSLQADSIADLRTKACIEGKDGELEWAEHLFKGYTPCDFETTAKMKIFITILDESVIMGDKLLVFSQSLSTIDVIEEHLHQRSIPNRGDERWAHNQSYFRMDGATPSMTREKLAKEFNSNQNIYLFLISTRAGGIGINLTGANRVVVFDASWNPCDDAQAVCRIYRYGQEKPCFIYRLISDGTLEKKIFDRQIGKQGTADRILDDLDPPSHLSLKESTTFASCDDKDPPIIDLTNFFTPDKILQTVVETCGHCFTQEPFPHASLLLEAEGPKISDAEKEVAKAQFRTGQAVGKILFSPKAKVSKDRNRALLDKFKKRLKNLRK